MANKTVCEVGNPTKEQHCSLVEHKFCWKCTYMRLEQQYELACDVSKEQNDLMFKPSSYYQ